MAKVTAYIRVGRMRSGKFKISATKIPTHEAVYASGEPLPTAAFALDLDIPNVMFRAGGRGPGDGDRGRRGGGRRGGGQDAMTPKGSGYAFQTKDGPAPMKLTTIAKKITSALKKLEADTAWNESNDGRVKILSKPVASKVSAKIKIRFGFSTTTATVTKEKALEYLAWLEGGGRGTIWTMRAEQIEARRRVKEGRR